MEMTDYPSQNENVAKGLSVSTTEASTSATLDKKPAVPQTPHPSTENTGADVSSSTTQDGQATFFFSKLLFAFL